jgi:hypothetical protein
MMSVDRTCMHMDRVRRERNQTDIIALPRERVKQTDISL